MIGSGARAPPYKDRATHSADQPSCVPLQLGCIGCILLFLLYQCNYVSEVLGGDVQKPNTPRATQAQPGAADEAPSGMWRMMPAGVMAQRFQQLFKGKGTSVTPAWPVF